MEPVKASGSAKGRMNPLHRLNVGMGFALLGVVALSALVLRMYAASVENIKDTMSNQGASATSTHVVSFALSGANTFAAGEQIAVDFPESSAFTQSGTWAAADFSFNDGTSRTVAGVNAGAGITTVTCTDGANNVGVALNTTTLTFRVLPCGGSYAASGFGASVSFTINGSAPDGTLTNPSSTGSYVVNVTDAGGDCQLVGDSCAMGVVIVSSSLVTVSATVASTCGNGVLEGGEACDDGNVNNGDGCSSTCQTEGGGGGPPPDTTPPGLSNIQCANLTTSTADIRWDTNETADSTVNYGPTASYGSTQSSASMVIQHVVGLTGLTEGTTYHYRVCSKDSSNNSACSGDQTCTIPDNTPPSISAVTVTGLSCDQATITWTTNEASSSFVDYDTDAGSPYANSSGNGALVTSHSVTVTGLSADTIYHYRVRSGDAANNEAFTANATFNTSASCGGCVTDCANVRVEPYLVTPTRQIRMVGSAFVQVTDVSPGIKRYSFEDTGSDMDLNDVIVDVNLNTCSAASFSANTAGSNWANVIRAEVYYNGVLRKDDVVWANSQQSAAPVSWNVRDDQAICGQPPSISSIQVSAISATGATVTWTTSEPSGSFVDYGTTSGYGSTAGNGTLVTSHSVTLTGLTESTIYDFRVRSANGDGVQGMSGNQSFTTLDVTAPVISAISVSAVTGTGATVTWTTSEPASNFVDYDVDAGVPYASTAGTASPHQTTRSVTLTGLTPNTTYHYRVRSADASGNESASANATFVTLDTAAPVISAITVTNLTATGARVSWTTNEASDSVVQYGTTLSYGQSVTNAAMVTSHQVNLTGLTAGTLYNFRVLSKDAANNTATSSNATFTTTGADVTAPVISAIAVSSITQIGATVTWTTDEASTSYVDYGTTASYGLTAGNATAATSHSVSLTGLTAGTTYYYRVRSADASGNNAQSGGATFVTLALSVPQITNVQATNVTGTGAVITWTTDEAASSWVDFGPTAAYGQSSGRNTPRVTSHSVTLAGLDAGTEYHFRARSADAQNNQGQSSDFTFTTSATQAAVISNVQVVDITQTTARVTWVTDIPADSKVDYGLTTQYGNTRADTALVTQHSVSIDGLTKSRTYQYSVRSRANGQDASSPNATFMTAADSLPPGNVSPFTASAGNAFVDLAWGNPADPDYLRTIILRKQGSFPANPTDGLVIYDGTGTTHTDLGLVNDTTYYYTAFAYDDVPNYSSGVNASATPTGPPDLTPPSEITGFTATVGDQSVILSWDIPSDDDWVGVRIVRRGNQYPTSVTDGSVVYSGSGTSTFDAGLENGITYYYAAFSFDGVPNYSNGVTATARPEQPLDTTPPPAVSILSAEAGDGMVQLSWSNPVSPDWVGTRIVRRTDGYPQHASDGSVVFEGNADNRIDADVINGVTYYYAAFSYDSSRNYASPVTDSATPRVGNPVPPPLSCTDSDGGAVYEALGIVTAGGNTYQDSCVSGTELMENYCDAGTRATLSHVCQTGFKCASGRCIPDTVEQEVCGNGICAGGENQIRCRADCAVGEEIPVVVPPPSTVTPEDKMELSDLKFFTAGGKVQLVLDGRMIRGYSSMALQTYLPDAAIKKPIKNAYFTVGDKSTVMTPTASYEARSTLPSSPGIYQTSIGLYYEDGTSDVMSATIETMPRSYVYESVDGREVPVEGVRVTLLELTPGGVYGLWGGTLFSQANPTITNTEGEFSFIVPPGTYKVVLEREGYASKETLPFPVHSENVVSKRLQLFRKTEGLGEAIAAAPGVALDRTLEAIDNEFVEQGSQAAAPVAAAAAFANVAAAGAATASAVPYLLYVYSFFAQPAQLIARRRRTQWGVVYNSLTKLPVDLAIIRLIDAKTGRVVRSSVTDKAGRYFFIVQPGDYKMAVVKVGFAFPTAFLRGDKEDAKFVDLYHDEVIKVASETTITANIPLDPVTVAKAPLRVLLEGIGRRFQKAIGILAIVAMTAAVVVTPTPMVIGLFFGNLLLYAVFHRIALPPKPKSWGIVYDDKSGSPLQNAVARIFETKYNKLLETQVTDLRGRYAFLVGANTYYVTFEKPGYVKQQKGPLDLTKIDDEKAAKIVAVDVRLTAVSSAETPPQIPPPTPLKQQSSDEEQKTTL